MNRCKTVGQVISSPASGPKAQTILDTQAAVVKTYFEQHFPRAIQIAKTIAADG
ncbi:MAG: hypothetical protein ACR2NN_05695 [Bryobacteraceae bacterium]